MQKSKYTYYLFGLVITSEFVLNIQTVATQEAAVQIAKEKFSLKKHVDVPQDNNIQRLGFQLRARGSVEASFLSWEKDQDYIHLLINAGTSITIDTNITDPKLLSVFLLNEAVGMILFQRGYFLLHASAVEIEGRAVIFMGEPGMGKSTLAAAFAHEGYRILSDDLVVITFDNEGRPILIPAPARIKIWPPTVERLGIDKEVLQPLYPGSKKLLWSLEDTGKKAPVLVDKFHQLLFNETGTPILRAIRGADALQVLFEHCPIPTHFMTTESRQQRMAHCLKILEKTPLYNFERPKDFSLLNEQIRYLVSISENTTISNE